jgi:type VII secretion integral membrane protein EccD
MDFSGNSANRSGGRRRTAAMTTQTVVGSGEVCRLTVYGPKSRVELAVPAHVPLADLLPTFLGHLGQELATTGLDHGGWVLQRLGEPPLEEDLGTAALGLYDGDILHLRPRDEQLPPVDFDDLVDGVADGIAKRKDAWRPEFTRRLSLAAGALTLVSAGCWSRRSAPVRWPPWSAALSRHCSCWRGRPPPGPSATAP